MKDVSNRIEQMAARLADRELEWNELPFLGWKEFRQMAPAVIRLEISRLERFGSTLEPGSNAYNTFVRARYGLRCFADGLDDAPREELRQRTEHLRRALLALSFLTETCESDVARYAVHRLTYIHDRIKLIY